MTTGNLPPVEAQVLHIHLGEVGIVEEHFIDAEDGAQSTGVRLPDGTCTTWTTRYLVPGTVTNQRVWALGGPDATP